MTVQYLLFFGLTQIKRNVIMVLMPDPNLSLPQIGQTSQNQPAPPQGVDTGQVAVQTPSADLAGQENVSLAGRSSRGGRFSKIPIKLILAIVLPVIVIAISYYVYFVYIPNSQSSSYVSQTWGDYEKLTEQINTIKSNGSVFEDASTSFEISKGSYFDIAQSVVYTEALVDAKKDLENIKNTQFIVSEARRGTEKYRVGKDVRELDKQLDAYLTKIEEGFNRLQLYEDFRVDMLDAIGEEFNQELAKLLDVNSPTVAREEKVVYLTKLQQLNREALDRLSALTSIPDDMLDFYNVTVSNHKDLDAALALMLTKFGEGTAEGDRAAVVSLAEYAQRQADRSKKIKEINSRVAKESETTKVFTDAVSMEEKLISEFYSVREKYGQLPSQ